MLLRNFATHPQLYTFCNPGVSCMVATFRIETLGFMYTFMKGQNVVSRNIASAPDTLLLN